MVKGMAAFVSAHATHEMVVLSKKELLARAEAASIATTAPPGEAPTVNGEISERALALRRTDEIDLAYFQLSHVVSATIAPLLDRDKQLVGAYFAESTAEDFFESNRATKDLPAPTRVAEWLATHTSRSLQAAQDYKSLPFLAITSRLRDTRARLMERQFLLKRLILGEFDLNDTHVFIPEEMPPLPVPKLDRSAFLRDAFANRPEFQQALVQADAEDVRVRFAYNQLLPQLDVIATYGLNGLSGTYEASADRAFRGHEPSWVVGLNLQIPFMNIQARARRDEALASQYQAILRIKQVEHLIGNEVDTVITRIEINRQRLETARNTRALNEEAVRIVYRRLEEGQLSTFDVIEQQKKLYDAKSREFAAVSELNKAISQLWLVTGTVLERSGIHVTSQIRGLRVAEQLLH